MKARNGKINRIIKRKEKTKKIKKKKVKRKTGIEMLRRGGDQGNATSSQRKSPEH